MRKLVRDGVYVVIVLALVIFSSACRKKSGSCSNPLAPGCVGTTVTEIRNVEVHVPNGASVKLDEEIKIDVQVALAVLPNEMVTVSVCISEELNRVTITCDESAKKADGFGNLEQFRLSYSKSYGGSIPPRTVRYVHTVVGRGVFPWRMGPIPSSSDPAFLAWYPKEWTIELPAQEGGPRPQ